MDAVELDLAISELETRLERLRSLYEQYFLGIEKIPPQVARKDVDRRIWELRRVKIRNTARRFKLQTVIQRYNTFQQYWQRILREIENGTYKRHVLRAERATSKSTIDDRRSSVETATVGDAPEQTGEEANARELGSLLDSGTDLDAELKKALAEASAPAKPAPQNEVAASPAAPSGGAASAAPAPKRRVVETLDLDMDGFDFGPAAATAVRKVPAPAGPKAGPASSVVKRAAATSLPRPAILSRPASLPRPAIQTPTPGKLATPATPTAGTSAPASPPVRPKPAVPPARVKPGLPPARPGAAPRKNPLAALGSQGAGTAPAGSAPSPVRPKPPVPVRKAEPAAPRVKATAAPARQPLAPRAPAAAANGLTDQRIAELHTRLVNAKRKTNEGGNVSVKGLAKSLRAAESKLRKQHKDRHIDFDVVIKDGRAIVKPRVR